MNTYREAEEADQQQLVTQLSRATKVIRDLEGVPDLRDDEQREALCEDDEAMLQALASVQMLGLRLLRQLPP